MEWCLRIRSIRSKRERLENRWQLLAITVDLAIVIHVDNRRKRYVLEENSSKGFIKHISVTLEKI